jgi:hypothetical protein
MRSCTQFLIRDVEKGAQLLGIKLEIHMRMMMQ